MTPLGVPVAFGENLQGSSLNCCLIRAFSLPRKLTEPHVPSGGRSSLAGTAPGPQCSRPRVVNTLTGIRFHKRASKPECKKQCNPVYFPLSSLEQMKVEKGISTERGQRRDLDQPGLRPLPSTAPLNCKCVKPWS